jgi:hypothetical protein
MLETWGTPIWTTLTTLWPWGILAVVTLVVGLIVEILTRNQTSRRAATYRALVTMLVAPAVFYGIQKVVEAPERAAEMEDKQKSNMLLNDIAARVGSPEAARELIELRARALFAPSTDDAERFARELITRLPESQALHKGLQDDSARETMRLRLNLEPFLRAFLEQFDQRVAAIRSRGIEMTTTPANSRDLFMGEVQLVRLDRSQQQLLRYARTPDGYELKVYMKTGQVHLGKLDTSAQVHLIGTRSGDRERNFGSCITSVR